MMTSYFIVLPLIPLLFRLAKPISENHRAHLSHPIRLCAAAVALQVDHFLDTRFTKHMVAAFHPFLKSEPLQQSTTVVKTKGRVGSAAKQAAKRLVGTHFRILAPLDRKALL